MMSKGCLYLFMLSLSLLFACHSTTLQKEKYRSDHYEITPKFQSRAPANLAIMPIESVTALDAEGQATIRKMCYNSLLGKGYAPLSLSFTNAALRDIGRFHTPLCMEKEWNTSPFKEIFTEYSDALAFISIENYLESGQPDRHGIEIWGKIGIFDAKTMEKLYECYTRRTLYPTDPGGGRKRFILKAYEEFVDLLTGRLPPRTQG